MFHDYNEALELARAYVPFQEYGETYQPDCALERGTVFPGLYKPYDGCGKYKPGKD